MSILMCFVTFIAIVFSKDIYYLLGASKYYSYILYFRILLIAELIFTISNFYSTYLGFALKTYISLIICIIGAIINLVTLFLFIRSYGIAIASVSILIANIVMAGLIYVYSYRKEQVYIQSQLFVQFVLFSKKSINGYI